MKTDADKMRKRIISELNKALDYAEIPEGAIQFEEIQKHYKGLAPKKIRTWLNEKVALGKWKKQRYGQQVYYWPVDKKEDQSLD